MPGTVFYPEEPIDSVIDRARLKELHVAAIREAKRQGIAAHVGQKLDELWDAHEELIEAARSAVERRIRVIPYQAIAPWEDAYNALTPWAESDGTPPQPQDVPVQPAIALTPEEMTILETLAGEAPMTVTQEALTGPTKLSDKTVRKYLGELRTQGFVDQPRGQKKGFGITTAGFAAIKRK
jgi:predicted transcriptional regulator